MGASELWAGKSLLLPAKPVHLCSIPGICTVKEQNWLPQVVLWPAHAHKQTDRQTENHKVTKKHTQDQWNVEKIIINTCSEQGSENRKGPEKSLTALPGFDPYMSAKPPVYSSSKVNHPLLASLGTKHTSTDATETPIHIQKARNWF